MEDVETSFIYTKSTFSEVRLKNILTVTLSILAVILIHLLLVGGALIIFLSTTNWKKHTLLVISFDGFRAEYLSRYRNVTNNLYALGDEGIQVEYMKPVFPTMTFTNHYSIVTGLYSESHGIIGNSMYDVNTTEIFRLGSPESYKAHWWGGEPLWVTANEQQKISATVFWPGSETRGRHPTFYEKFNSSWSNEERMKRVYHYLELPFSERPDLLMAYFQRVDDAGHHNGPDSREVYDEIKALDEMVGRLIKYLTVSNLKESVDLVFVSDHGMATSKTQVLLDTLVPEYNDRVYVNEWMESPGYSTVVNIRAKRGLYDVPGLLVDLAKSPRISCFSRKDIPQRFRIRGAITRVGDILCVAEIESYMTTQNFARSSVGVHGYDNNEPDMRSIFIANGPSFKGEEEMEPFTNIELYNVFCHILNIVPKPNNGTFDTIAHILRK